MHASFIMCFSFLKDQTSLLPFLIFLKKIVKNELKILTLTLTFQVFIHILELKLWHCKSLKVAKFC